MILKRTILLTFLFFLLCAAPSCADYSFEGIPLEIIAQGSIQGEIVLSSSLGISSPPTVHQLTLEREPVWARVYTGVWGGTERYKGWAMVDINGRSSGRITLYGSDDTNEGVYASGNGVYWIAVDATDDLEQGSNTITVTTSRGEPDNKLDGRVYGIFVVALLEDPGSPVFSYWIAEGNENLHGEGWAGKNPTRKDRCDLAIDGVDPKTATSADLTVVLLASTWGQPDFLLFNDRDLGLPAGPAQDYLPGARDIGNERSMDATGGQGTDTRYADIETLDVTILLEDKNEIVFERGRELDGDGVINTAGLPAEGEDYIHPVIALLTVEREKTAPPDLSVDPITVTNAYEGEYAAIRTAIRNTGLMPPEPAKVTFSVDGVPVDSLQVTTGYQGIYPVEGSWLATAGKHEVSVSVSCPGDAVQFNNHASRSITVGSPPDLSVSIGEPRKEGAAATSAQGMPFPYAGALAGAAILLLWIQRKGQPGTRATAVFLIAGIVGLSFVPAISDADTGITQYTIPVTIHNSGDSEAPPFILTLYLDGEKVVEHEVSGGILAGGTEEVAIPVFTGSGKHVIRVVADERCEIQDQNRADNSVERVYEFP
ncbi:MAG: DUF3344 domain-containing protein [Methanoregulaceae archaeon]|nr:DUF3344 domain-containing protein [Methanoregulaceae archaeon]